MTDLREAAHQAPGSLKALGAQDGYAAKALAAALEGEPTPSTSLGRAVMTLDWGHEPDRGPSVLTAPTPLGKYFIYRLTGFHIAASGPSGFKGNFKRMETAKKAAQMHLEATVRACLAALVDPAPAPTLSGVEQ